MTFQSIDQWWWPYVFIALGGWLATDLWRFVGVFLGERIADDSDILVLVRCVATALVAGVIANLIVFPGGALAATPLILRIGAAAAGFGAYLTLGRHIIVGIVVGEAVLIVGMFL
jgi:hypothetical protein